MEEFAQEGVTTHETGGNAVANTNANANSGKMPINASGGGGGGGDEAERVGDLLPGASSSSSSSSSGSGGPGTAASANVGGKKHTHSSGKGLQSSTFVISDRARGIARRASGFERGVGPSGGVTPEKAVELTLPLTSTSEFASQESTMTNVTRGGGDTEGGATGGCDVSTTTTRSVPQLTDVSSSPRSGSGGATGVSGNENDALALRTTWSGAEDPRGSGRRRESLSDRLRGGKIHSKNTTGDNYSRTPPHTTTGIVAAASGGRDVSTSTGSPGTKSMGRRTGSGEEEQKGKSPEFRQGKINDNDSKYQQTITTVTEAAGGGRDMSTSTGNPVDSHPPHQRESDGRVKSVPEPPPKQTSSTNVTAGSGRDMSTSTTGSPVASHQTNRRESDGRVKSVPPPPPKQTSSVEEQRNIDNNYLQTTSVTAAGGRDMSTSTGSPVVSHQTNRRENDGRVKSVPPPPPLPPKQTSSVEEQRNIDNIDNFDNNDQQTTNVTAAGGRDMSTSTTGSPVASHQTNRRESDGRVKSVPPPPPKQTSSVEEQRNIDNNYLQTTNVTAAGGRDMSTSTGRLEAQW